MSQMTLKSIAITGGPGAGKTTVLSLVKKMACKHTAILPEAASLIYKGGFWRLDSVSAKVAAQKAIFHVQSEMENLVRNEGQWSVALCDRGTLDGLAYWPLEAEKFWETFQTNLQQELARYEVVIHLRSPNMDNGYNYINPIRIETPSEALMIDEKIYSIWSKHPNYYEIKSTKSFIEKINQCLYIIQQHLPSCCPHNVSIPTDLVK